MGYGFVLVRSSLYPFILNVEIIFKESFRSRPDPGNATTNKTEIKDPNLLAEIKLSFIRRSQDFSRPIRLV